MEKLEIIEIPGYGSTGPMLKIGKTKVFKIAYIKTSRGIPLINKDKKQLFMAEKNKELQKTTEWRWKEPNSLIIYATIENRETLIIQLESSKNYIWLIDDE